ncbi:MFS transporter [Pseudooceanicola sp. CBS1P-1]|uniref:MFS transporter n=1 Tax=Pseudooceanicola albus TaxID=2692189 RepID=A0A6L7G514_9RHOB|nr:MULTISPECIES: MFS transporter [Pseudooceanicola]MBT9386128.1 MFS transporter [Pseudooceanicola endophyticus]MXN19454.1 MFS transporter [Pseudooceanicola albus]
MSLAGTVPRAGAGRVIWSVGYVHGLSHLYMLALPPLFPLLSRDLGASLAGLAGILGAFNLITAATQYLAGVAVDRFGGLRCLRIGLALSLLSLALAALAPGFWTLAGAFALCGLANAVYHPGDFQLLNSRVPAARRPFALSVHNFAGNVGFALAPALLAPVGFTLGWRAALGLAVILGLPGLLALFLLPGDAPQPRPGRRAPGQRTGLAEVAGPAVLLQLLIFTLFSLVSGGVQSFSVLAGAGHFGYGLSDLNRILALYLLVGTTGIVLGGTLLQRGWSETTAFASGIVLAMAGWGLAWSGLGGLQGYSAGMLVIGFAMGFILPARDVIVARMTPPHLQGRIYGFVTTGINIGQFGAPVLVAPMVQGGHTGLYYAFLMAALVASLLAGLSSRTARPKVQTKGHP